MVEINILTFGGGFSAREQGGTYVQKDDDPIQPGNYYISELEIHSVGI